MMKRHALALLIAAAIVPAAFAGVIDKAQRADAATAAQTWSAWGGTIGFRWNQDLLSGLGVALTPDQTVAAPVTNSHADFRPHVWFAVRETGGLEFTVANGSLRNFSGGSLAVRGGYSLRLRDGSSIDLRNLTLRVRENDPRVLDVIGGDGKAWFYTDRVMFELANSRQALAVRSADLRISQALANRLGVPDAANWEIADIAMNTEVNIAGGDAAPDRVCNPYPWPGVSVPDHDGQTYIADLFMESFSVDPVGCQSCDGPGGANDGIVSWAPTSSLINNINDGTAQQTVPGDPLGTSQFLYTANVAWYTMFSGSNPPYTNDQHPFLIWNLYRTNPDGTFQQIGRSGVKHAFVTINFGCLDSCNEPHSLGRGCGDTYGSGNNDSPSDMGPRSEIVPAQGIWGRCGSIWDPACTGSEHNNGNTSWTQRMQTHESQVDPAANVGATYMIESWYVARDDQNIHNSMATITGTPHWGGGVWAFNSQANYKLGPAIDRWVSPTAPAPGSLNSEISSSEGHAKVAVKVTALGGNSWRYDYAVENLDYSRAILEDPAHGTDPRVVSNKGFDSFSVPIPAGANVTATSFQNGSLDGSGAWTSAIGANSVTWNANGATSLDWGSMYSFSLTVNASPAAGRPQTSPRGNGAVTLHVANSGSPASYSSRSIVPVTL
jgi:hypothetical protein